MKTMNQWAVFFRENIENGASESDIIQDLKTFASEKVEEEKECIREMLEGEGYEMLAEKI